MKRLSLLMPLGVLLAGCSGQAADNSASNNTADSAAPIASTAAPAVPAATIASTTSAPASSAPASTSAGSGAKPAATVAVSAKSGKGPDPAYPVVDYAQPGMDPNLVAVLHKVTVPPPPLSLKVPDKVDLLVTTSQGLFTIELNGKEAPLHTKSFYYLAKRHFFDGTKFHRYDDLTGDGNGFIIQGGDPLTKYPDFQEDWGQGGPGYHIPREHNSLTHVQFAVAAARTTDPDSAGSQFYIVLGPGDSFLDTSGGGYTVFGKVVTGQDAAAKLRAGDSIESIKPVQ